VPEVLAPKAGTEVAPPKSDDSSALGKPTKSVAEDIKLNFPDGVVVDKELVEKFTPLAKEFGLKNDQAQKLVDMYVERNKAQQTAVTEAWTGQQKEWAAANRADKDIGGQAYDANVEMARSAIDRFGGDVLRKEIDALGIGDNPALLKAWVAVGKAMSPDHVGRIGNRANQGNADEEAQYRKMYPSMYNPDGTRKQT
jgi:hypothetical protein